MIKNILILTDSPFMKRDYDRFGIDILNQYFHVRVFDCTPWLKPDYWSTYSDIRYEFSGYRSIMNWEDFETNIRDTPDGIVIDYLASPKGARIRIALRRWKIKRVTVQNALIPYPRVRVFDNFINKLRRGRIFNRVMYRLKKTVTSVARKDVPDIAILSGELGIKDFRARAHHRIWAHHFDYDIYLSIQQKIRSKTAPYAVLLDEDIVYHSDYSYCGIDPPTSEQNYYPSMNRFLNTFQNLTGLSVVIAAHPRSRYDLRPHLYNGREVVMGKTAELVRDALLVFAHGSDSSTFAVLEQKPIIFLTTNDVQESWEQPYIDARRNLLNAPLINIDLFNRSDINIQAWSHIDKSRYLSYKRLYIKRPNTPELPLWEIFSAYVRENLN